MAKIEREVSIPFGTDVAKKKIIDLVESLKENYGSVFSDIKWNEDKTAADIAGKGFKGNFALNNDKLKIVADLGLALGLFKGKIEQELDTKIAEFTKDDSANA